MAILEVKHIDKSFGGFKALDNVSLEAEESKVTGLIGPNGAGKSTLLNIISGFLEADRGEILMGGRDITGLPPHRCSEAGIARTFQDSQVLFYMTGLDNVVVSSPGQRGELEYNALFRPLMVAAEERERRAEAIEHLEHLNIRDKATSLAQALSYGQQKLLEFGRMLNSRAKVFLLDEPMAGIHPDLMQGIGQLIKTAATEHGKAVILVEHNLKTVMELSDHVVVVREHIVLEGPPEKISDDERLTGAFLGVVRGTT